MGCSCGRSLQASHRQKWAELGGDELEEPLQQGWVKLVRASWLVELSERGGILSRRQDLPREAFVSLDELKAAGPFQNSGWSWLRIIVLSYPWLQPGHPDPHGENLRVIAKALKHYIKWKGPQLYGVLIDFTSLFQTERTANESDMFKSALPALNKFYSHPHTVVLKVTEFPPGYPNQGTYQYALPEGANTVAYAERGWCFTESAMSGLVKSWDQVLDASRVSDAQPTLFDIIDTCKSGRTPPLPPEEFNAELDKKVFTCKKDDFEKVAKLYTDAFQQRLDVARELDYSLLGWGPDEVRKLVRALRTNSALTSLSLSGNPIGPEGAAMLAEVLRSNNVLRALQLWESNIDAQGAASLAWALRGNESLTELDIMVNNIGPEGAAALAEALRSNTCLQMLDITGIPGLGVESATAFAEALRVNTSLRTLKVSAPSIGDEGKAALAEAVAAGRVKFL